ncbi:sigma factor-like helix-turn-helix DNA-binding protein [Paenibacillus agricola]|uniref:Fis family transcriptional regulator n=1 Tax=Paenibacillus agricola TaxID=2716264 RepID=A0ABX0JBK2_9BACL|nr:sigma factor-like helix-turn-helix DNA-binding protein [Paenibacillus agricola]NHN33527.1 Fis family transcriptional regulator [Paenibacillus agricola]
MKLWVEELLAEYNQGKNQLLKYRDRLDPEDKLQKEESLIVDSMISDMNYSIEWLRRGRRPGSMRGVDRKDAYPRAALMDMDLFPSLDIEPQEVQLTDERKKQMVEVLLLLSKRERQCYLLHMVQGMSLAEIGAELDMAKGAVQTYILRAKTKVGQAV